MKFFIDTANTDHIIEAAGLGVLDGVTTNPSLLSREIQRTGKDSKTILKNICQIVKGPVSAEVLTFETEDMIKEARKLVKIDDYIVVKIPVTRNGLKAVKTLALDGIKTNVTLTFSPTQAILAAKAGATYVSPFVGRLDDISHYGMDLAAQIITIYQNYSLRTEVIVASIRNPIHVVEAAMMGAHIATIPFSVIEQLLKHPLTDIGIERFAADWKKVTEKSL
jgi:transaldolase